MSISFSTFGSSNNCTRKLLRRSGTLHSGQAPAPFIKIRFVLIQLCKKCFQTGAELTFQK